MFKNYVFPPMGPTKAIFIVSEERMAAYKHFCLSRNGPHANKAAYHSSRC